MGEPWLKHETEIYENEWLRVPKQFWKIKKETKKKVNNFFNSTDD